MLSFLGVRGTRVLSRNLSVAISHSKIPVGNTFERCNQVQTSVSRDQGSFVLDESQDSFVLDESGLELKEQLECLKRIERKMDEVKQYREKTKDDMLFAAFFLSICYVSAHFVDY